MSRRAGAASGALAVTAVLLMLRAMVPTEDVVSLFGHDIPTVCAFRLIFGTECLGCGMTRSLAFAADGDLAASWRLHHGGPVLFSGLLLALPLSLSRLWPRRGWREAG